MPIHIKRNSHLKMTHFLLVIFMMCCTGLNSVLAGEITQGMMLSNSCAACHGTDGRSPGAIPSIHGKSAAFISQSLRDFRDGSRPATVMGRHAKGYTVEEIELIANHFANLK